MWRCSKSVETATMLDTALCIPCASIPVTSYEIVASCFKLHAICNLVIHDTWRPQGTSGLTFHSAHALHIALAARTNPFSNVSKNTKAEADVYASRQQIECPYQYLEHRH